MAHVFCMYALKKFVDENTYKIHIKYMFSKNSYKIHIKYIRNTYKIHTKYMGILLMVIAYIILANLTDRKCVAALMFQ
jgi:hypothetical protein